MPVLLTHIPRTGGTSLFAALRNQQPQAKGVEFESLAELALMTDKELNNYDLISTYVGSKIFDRLDNSWTKIIVLREPVTRLKSSYWNLRNDSKNISFARSFAKSHGFRGYLASREVAVIVQATNVQTWTVLGDRSISFRKRFSHLGEKEICNLAISRLSSYDFVGFTDRLDELWSRLCSHFGWQKSILPRLRADLPMPELEEASPEDLTFHTSLDCELLHHARNPRELRAEH